MRSWTWASLWLLLASVASGQLIDLSEGERVVFVGGTLIEREARYGHWELMLTSRFPGKRVTFRNLGWSGDTVWGEARAGFGTPADGYKHLTQHLTELKPTRILFCYGGNESAAGAKGVDAFSRQYATLLDHARSTGARIVLMAPLRQETLPPPLPNPAVANRRLWDYIDQAHELAVNRDLLWLDIEAWIERHRQHDAQFRLTDNGLHLTSLGYWITAAMIENELQFSPSGWQLVLDAQGKVIERHGVEMSQFKASQGDWRFTLKPHVLPVTAPLRVPGRCGVLTMRNLPPGRYALKIGEQRVVEASHDEWSHGVAVDDGAELRQIETLRQTIVKKNELYFHRWRPQNITYLFGFRKHEQGQNAREIPQFDPLIEAEERRIVELSVPRGQSYELVRLP